MESVVRASIGRLPGPRFFLTSRFTILSFVWVIALAVVMSVALSAFLTHAVSGWEWENTAALVRREVERSRLDALFTAPVDARERWGRELSQLLESLPEVARVKAWDDQATVLWSDEPELIGRRFPDNAALRAALAGEVAVEIKTPNKREQMYARDTFPTLAEVYVPVLSRENGRLLGVLEVYKTPHRLLATIQTGRFLIWAISLAGGAVLYLVLVPLVAQVYGRELRERTLRGYADTLAYAVAARTRQLREKTQETEQANAALSKAQEELVQAQKSEAVGRLAGGVAHDFNNLLTVISGRSRLLLHRLTPDEPLRRQVALIEQTAHRAAELTQQLLAFSRRQALQPKVLDLDAAVAGVKKMLQRLIGEDIDVVTVKGRSLGSVRADSSQVEQVILNLAVNARDAMPQGGRLIIETANSDLDEAFAGRHPGARPGRYVMLGVSDNGVGMDAETQARIFEPYFTTKEPGKGTGLGLAIVYSIVKQSGGYVAVTSEPGQGTTVKVYLPRVEAVRNVAEPSPVDAELPDGSETILLVEDEESVRDLAREILEIRGYTVLTARHPGEALLVAERHPNPIHLMVTDVVMPQMGGHELSERLATVRPGLKVLYMSGYTPDARQPDPLNRVTDFLGKPFTPGDLARKVREMLDAPKT